MHRFMTRATRFVGALVIAFGIAGTPAHAQDTDPQALELSRKILELTNTLAMGEQMLSMLMPQITDLVAKANPERGEEVAQLIREHLEPSLRDGLPELFDECAKVYARHFTVAELTELTAFYGTPLGQKLIASQSAVLLDLNQVGQRWGMNAAQRALQNLVPIFKERGLQVPI